MKATELMIGDWVLWKPSRGGFIGIVGGDRALTPEFTKIKASHLDSILTDYYPIPLTPEILEKNGWMQNGITQEEIMECDGENCDDTWCEMTYDGELNCYFDYEEDAVLFTCDRGCDFLKIHFVHELQHALRLCGLYDLENNFKIK